MPWNNNGGGPQGPWGGQNQNPQPPDMDKVIELARQKFGNKFSGRKIWPIVLGVAFVLWMATGVYVVGPDEQGVVLRFGRYVETTLPGPHFRLPFPIDTVYTPKVTQVQRIEVGYRTRGRSMVDVPAESLMLTGDENIIDIDLSVQYLIKDAANSLFNVRNPREDPHKVVRNAAESAIRRVVGRNSIDEALTTGKDGIQQDTKKTIQQILDRYKSGIHIVTVQLQQVAPPKEVVQAFKDVASAREDRERTINEAEGYANDILPKAKGDAARMIQEAEGYKASYVSRSKGDVARFLSLLEQYEKARDVTRKRLYLETMEDVLTGMDKVILGSQAGQGVLPYLPLNRDGNVSGRTAGKGEAR
ncbi:MAG: FtsH protease activity modulator HflK [Magnetococcales bacterium]|nr:FtsH protease activity modulator HflK [Magnetococcales bacterium]